MRQRVHVLGNEECRKEEKLGKVDEEDMHMKSLQLVALVAFLVVLSFFLWPYATGLRAPPRRIRRPLMYGLSEGNYSYLQGITCKNCASKLGFHCGFNATGSTKPPAELLRAGALGLRNNLTLWSQCFLWYTNTWWSRATGGSKGLMFYKHGGVDDKSQLQKWLEDYDKKHGCDPFQVTPVTLSLGDKDACLEFYSNNRRWSPSDNALWFMKESKGSQGTHIKLWSSRKVQGLWMARDKNSTTDEATKGRRFAQIACPDNTTVASLSVSDPWLIDGYKFDNRVYILVASITPLLVLFHSGHLRFSQVLYSEQHDSEELDRGSARAKPPPSRFDGGVPSGFDGGVEGLAKGGEVEKDARMAMHITNPRFGLAHTNDTRKVLRPVRHMWDDLLGTHGKDEARIRWKQLQLSVRNAALQTVFASRHALLGKGGYTDWGFALLALDVAYDTRMNAYVLDVNSGPSFYHILPPQRWPAWFADLRSATIRQAVDVVQEVAFRKIQDTGGHNATLLLGAKAPSPSNSKRAPPSPLLERDTLPPRSRPSSQGSRHTRGWASWV